MRRASPVEGVEPSVMSEGESDVPSSFSWGSKSSEANACRTRGVDGKGASVASLDGDEFEGWLDVSVEGVFFPSGFS